MAMRLDYKPTRYEGKGFLKNLNIRIHRDITGEMWFGGGVDIAKRELLSFLKTFFRFWFFQKMRIFIFYLFHKFRV
jgi:hypothetical protein